MPILRRLSLAVAALVSLSAPARADVPALGAAVDAPGLVWSTGGNTSWTSQTAVTRDGVDAARATGLAALDSSSWIETTVAAPGSLSWQWRLDLPADSGAILECFVGDEPIARAGLYTASDWSSASAVIHGSGPTPVRWRLLRNTHADAPTEDAAYLDTVAYAPFGPPVLQTHANLTAHGFTARWGAVAQAASYTVELATSPDFADATFAASALVPATSVAVSGLEPSTTYHYRLIAHGPDSLSAVSAPRSLATPAIVRPANDAFAAATTLSGISGSASATTLDATTEPGESFSHRGSVWFNWTAPGAGLWRFQAASTADLLAPALHVYTGSALDQLDLAAAGSYDGVDEAYVVEFETLAGVTYRVVLDANLADQGAATLSWTRLASHTPPANDAFANPVALTGSSGSVDGTNLRATAEAGETAAHSVWFSWKAPASGVWTLETTGSAIPATLAVWSGSTLSGLSLLATDSAPAPAASRVSLQVAKDATYRVSLDGQNGAQGAVRLAWNLAVPSVAQTIVPPEIADLPLDALPFLLDAFATSGLPLTYTLLSGPATLANEVVTLAGLPGTVRIRASQPGDATYLPAQIDFEFVVRAPPSNDRVAGAQRLVNDFGSLDADLRFATADDFDPDPANRSLWFRWTADATGILTLDTADSAIPVTLEVFAGPSSDLRTVLSDLRPGVRPRLEVPITLGGEYFILLDTREATPGDARLAWSFAAPSLPQTIDFPALPDLGRSAAPFLLEATASSGLPVQFTLVSGPATLDGNLVTLTGKAGKVTVVATQPGDFHYQPAPAVPVTFEVRPPPANDDASAAIRLSGASGSATGSNVDASPEPFDPAPGLRSVWWRWTAPSTGLWTVDTAGGAHPVTLTLLAGNSPDSLVTLDADHPLGGYGKLTVPVYSGTVYWIVLDTLDEATGALNLSWTLAAPPTEQTILFDQELPDLVVGDPAPVLTPSATSGLPVTVVVVSGPARIVDGNLVLTDQPGTVTLRATQTGDAYHQPAAPVTRTFAVAQVPPVKITVSNLRQTYDGLPKFVTVVTEPDPRLGEVVVTYNGKPDLPVNAGTYKVLVTADKSKATAKLVIDKIPLLVTADDQRKLAGQPNPPLTVRYSGFAPGDDASSLVRAPVAKTPAKPASPGGAYAIKPSGGASPNYVFTYVPGILTVDTFAGRYEALLADLSGLPAGKLEFTVASSGKIVTGKLALAREQKVLSFRGELSLDSLVDLASATLSLKGKAGDYVLDLNLILEGRFDAVLSDKDGLLASASGGRKLFAPAPKEKLSWTGAHTALLLPASAEALAAPAGAGHATATIDAKGRLKLAGRLADGTAFTSTLTPDPDGGYRLFVAPYPKRTESYLAGEFGLLGHPDTTRFPGRRYLPASHGVTLAWTKARSTSDKAYPDGFAPLYPALVIDPWLRPKTPVEVALHFGPHDLDLGQYAAFLPTSGSLSHRGAFTLLAPVTTPANLAKFSLKLAPATGALSGGFVLLDQVAPPPAKPEKRTVKFTGVLRLPPEADAPAGALLGAGHFLVTPLSDSGLTSSLSGEIRLEKP